MSVVAQTKKKHTPEPWEWVFNGTGGNWALVHLESDFKWWEYVRVSGPPDMPLSADQLMLAAAPELFRELKHLVRLLESNEANGTLNIAGLATLNGPRAAIARAEGT